MEKKGMSRIKDNKIFVVQFNENQIKFKIKEFIICRFDIYLKNIYIIKYI